MSEVVDNRVVEMSFDNRQFESGVSTSLSTIEKLKNALSFENVGTGLESLYTTLGKGADLSGMTAAVDTVGQKFSALEVMAITALANITNSAVNYGKKLVSEFTIEPIATGFSEFELKMDSVQTIMAGTGESLQTVNGYLDELNKYADDTIYSFSDMTRNIGKFTNAGVKLEDAVMAIRGISNEAAVSGANAYEASRAMYNFAQALSAGYVKLIDWKSIENANMATVEFKNQLIETAVECGNLKKDAEGMYQILTENAKGDKTLELMDATHMFNESLSYQWMTTDVLVKTLGKYGDATTDIGAKASKAATEVKTYTMMMDALREAAQSGWAQTWEIFIGDFNEGKEVWTELSNVIGGVLDASAKARNGLLGDALTSKWKKVSSQIQETGISSNQLDETLKETLKANGYNVDKLIEKYNSLDTAIANGAISSDVFTQMMENLGEVYDKMDKESKKSIDGQALKSLVASSKLTGSTLSKTFKDLEKTSGRELIIDSLRNGLNALLEDVKLVKKAWRDIFPATTAEQLYAALEAVHKFSEGLHMGWRTADRVERTFKGLFAIFDMFGKIAKTVGRSFFGLSGDAEGFLNTVLDSTASIGDFLVALDEGFDKSGKFADATQKIADSIGMAIREIASFIKSVKTSYDEAGGGLSGVLNVAADAAERVLRLFGDIFKYITGKDISEFIDGDIRFLNQFNGMVQKVSSSVDNFFRNSAGDILMSSFYGAWTAVTAVGDAIQNTTQDIFDMGSAIKGSAIYNTLESIFNVVKGIAGSALSVIVKGVEKLGVALRGADASTIMDFMNAFLVGSLSFSIFKIGDTLDGLGDVIEGFTWKLKGTAIKEVAVSLAILSGALMLLSLIDPVRLGAATLALSVMTKELEGFSAFMRGDGVQSIRGFIGNADKASVLTTMMLSLAASMFIMALALKAVGGVEPDRLLGATAAISAVTAVMVGAVKLLSSGDSKSLTKGMTGLIAFALSLKIMASALKDIGEIEPENLERALGGLFALLVELGVFLGASSNINNMLKMGVALVGVGIGIRLLASAISVVGSLDPIAIAAGVAGLSAAMLAMIGFMKFLPKNMLSIGAGLIGVGAAMVLVGTAFRIFATVDPERLTSGFWGMGVVLAELVLALNGMRGTAGGAAALLLAATAITMLVPALLLLSTMSLGGILKSMIALGAALAVIGIGAAVLAPLAVPLLTVAEAMALMGIAIGAVGAGVFLLATGITALVATGSAGAVALMAAIEIIVTGIVTLLPTVATALAKALIQFIGTLIGGAAGLVSAVTELILAEADAIRQIIPAVLGVVVELFFQFVELLDENAPILAEAMVDILVAILQAIAGHMEDFTKAGCDLIIGLLNGIAEKLPDVIDAAFNVVISFINGLADTIENRHEEIYEAGHNLIMAVIDAIIDGIFAGIDTVKDAVLKIVDGIKELKEKFTEAGGHVIGGLIGGVEEKIEKVKSVGKWIGEKLLGGTTEALDEHSPSKEMDKVGLFAILGLTNSLEKNSDKVYDSSYEVGENALDGIRASMNGMTDILDGEVDFDPTIRPVLDLSNIQSGAAQMDSILGQQHAAAIYGSFQSRGITEAANTSILSGMMARLESKYNELVDYMSNSNPVPVNVNVALEGSTSKIFDVVVEENNRDMKMTGGKSRLR